MSALLRSAALTHWGFTCFWHTLCIKYSNIMHWMWKPWPPRCIITLLHRKWMKAQTSAGQCQEQLLAEPGSDPSPPNRSSQVRGTLDYVEWASTNLQSCSCLSWQSELRAETRLRDDLKNLKLTGSPEGSKKKVVFFHFIWIGGGNMMEKNIFHLQRRPWNLWTRFCPTSWKLLTGNSGFKLANDAQTSH